MTRKILMVSPFPPRRDGVSGGSRALGHTVEELSGFSLRVLYLIRGEVEPTAEAALATSGVSFEEIHRSGARIDADRLGNWTKAFSRGLPLWVANWDVAALRERVREVVTDWRPDVVQFELSVMGQYRDAAGDTPSILVVHEPATAAARDGLEFAPAVWKWLRRREAEAWLRYETEILPQFQAVVCFTERDRDQLKRLAPDQEYAVIPQVCSLPVSPSGRAGSATPSVVFVGNFQHPPNVDAALWLGREIFPKVLASHPNTLLTIVGAGPPRSVRALAGERILVTGRVADTIPYLDEATVVTVPVRMGGGIRTKMVEALGSGAAVVATPLAAEGLGVADGRECLLAEDAGELAAAIAALLGDARRRERLASCARGWAAEFCQPGRLCAALDAVYKRLPELR